MNRPSSTSPEQFNLCRAIIAQCTHIESNEALTTCSADRLVNLDSISSRERSGRKCRFSNRDNECGVMVVNISNCTDARGVIVIPTTHHSWFVIKPKSYWKTIGNSQNGTGNEGITYHKLIQDNVSKSVTISTFTPDLLVRLSSSFLFEKYESYHFRF